MAIFNNYVSHNQRGCTPSRLSMGHCRVSKQGHSNNSHVKETQQSMWASFYLKKVVTKPDHFPINHHWCCSTKHKSNKTDLKQKQKTEIIMFLRLKTMWKPNVFGHRPTENILAGLDATELGPWQFSSRVTWRAKKNTTHTTIQVVWDGPEKIIHLSG